MLEAKAIPTRIFKANESLKDFIIEHVKWRFQEGDILAVTSKVVSLAEGRLVGKDNVSKKDLIHQEADQFLGETALGCFLTIKHGQWIPSAGIDESNSEEGKFILYPKDPYASAMEIHGWLTGEFNLKNIGVLLTDSRTLPLRRGVIGTALAYYGFSGVESQIGQKDLFGKELKMTQINVADALAVAATFTMGEGGEGKPLAILKADVAFDEAHDPKEIRIDPEKDLYKPLLDFF